MKRLLYLVILLCLSSSGVWAGAAAESAAGSSSRGNYLATRGLIIPPDEVHIDSYIASVDHARCHLRRLWTFLCTADTIRFQLAARKR
ncbi:MAG: hypothetical protein JSV89_11050 [Spirochaetaceae bacterium]|nr:MAG: hypothetical protein JSV89_11050 [Spirochaetaceae bacterium]